MKNFIKKIQREIIRFYSKSMDRVFKTTKFDSFQKKYSNIYDNNYTLKKDQFSFVHIPRTGGTSLHTLLIENCNNFYNNAHNVVSLKSNPNNYKYITVLREPTKRIYSYYLMQKKYKKLPFHVHAKKDLSFFIEKVWSCKNGICKFLNGYINHDVDDHLFNISLNNLKKFYFIADYENLRTDVNKLRKKLNIKRNIEYINNYKTEKTMISNEELSIIKKYNYYDLKIYQIFKDQLYSN